MGDIAVEFEGVWKKFMRGERHDSLRDTIPALFKRFVRPAKEELAKGEFWALKDVSFQIRRGESLGIIGPNGAGKSTALKILSGILRPNQGRTTVQGRLSALIEVGAGFHPDLTGRENIYLNGSILGMSRREIAAKFDRIVDFAGVSEFIDTPIKRYSSGMQARLGFSVAAHMDPDVLLVDEVLSVGDWAFQSKCIRAMEQFKRSGVSCAFVSHNLQAVVSFCDRVVVVRRGQIEFEGSPHEGVGKYLDIAMGSSGDGSGEDGPVEATVEMFDAEGQAVQAVDPGQPVVLEARVTARRLLKRASFYVFIRDDSGQHLFNSSSARSDAIEVDVGPGETMVFRARLQVNLNAGRYTLGIGLKRYGTEENYWARDPAKILFVRGDPKAAGGPAFLSPAFEVVRPATIPGA